MLNYLTEGAPLPEFGILSMPNVLPSVFSGTRQRSSLSSAKQKTLGKRKHSAKSFLVLKIKHSAKASLPSVFSTLGKDNLKTHF
jgi:hypothetical protein